MLAEEGKGEAGGRKKEPDADALAAEADYRDRAAVQLLEGEEDDEERALREYRERMVALLPPAGFNFTGILAAQNELDKNFDAFMDEEYDDGKIGGLEDEEIEAED